MTQADGSTPPAEGYGFFAPPRPATAEALSSMPGTPVPTSTFGAPTSTFGASPFAAPSPAFGGPAAAAPAVNARSSSKLLWWILVPLVALVGIGFVAAVAVPGLLSQRATSQASGTTVSFPTSIGDRMRLTDADARAREATMVRALGGQARAGLYGSGPGAATMMVVAVPGPINPIRISAEMASFSNQAAAEGSPAADIAPGALGGQARCHDLSTGGQQMTTCLFADPGALVSVTLVGTGPAVRQQAVEARAVIERRAG